MRSRESVLKKIENLEGKLKQLRFYVQRGVEVEEYLNALSSSEKELEDLKAFIEREPMSADEMNPFI